MATEGKDSNLTCYVLQLDSPEDLVSEAFKLADLLNLTDLSDRFGLLSAFFFDKDHWNSLYRNLATSGPHASLAILDPVVEAFYAEKPSRAAQEKTSLPTIHYDGLGLSAYGRLALFTLELLKKEDATVSLFLSYPEKMTWILSELLKVRQGCLDGFQTPSSDAGIFYSPNLHVDANVVVFRTLLRDMSALVTSWITLALEGSWESQIIEALANGAQGISKAADDDDDDDLGCSATQFALDAIKEQDGFHERILTDVVQALAQSDSTEVSTANAKGWCQLLKTKIRMYLDLSPGIMLALFFFFFFLPSTHIYSTFCV